MNLSIRLVAISSFVAAATIGSLVLWARADSPAAADPSLPSASDYSATAVGSAAGDQARALSDGEITLEELNDATSNVAACLRDAGVTVEVVPGAGLRPATLHTTAGRTLADASGVGATLNACRAEHIDAVETAWALQQAHSSSDEISAAHQMVSECILERGGTIDDGFLSVDDLNELMLNRARTPAENQTFDAYRQCKAPVAEALGYQLP